MSSSSNEKLSVIVENLKENSDKLDNRITILSDKLDDRFEKFNDKLDKHNDELIKLFHQQQINIVKITSTQECMSKKIDSHDRLFSFVGKHRKKILTAFVALITACTPISKEIVDIIKAFV